MKPPSVSHFGAPELGAPPAILTVPGLNGSGPDHWQTLWEKQLPLCDRVHLPDPQDPEPEIWRHHIDSRVRATHGRVILVGHSLGSIAIVRWAHQASPALLAKVAGALLVAPCAVSPDAGHPALRRFAPIPRTPLAFPSILIASTDDVYTSIATSLDYAKSWRSAFVNIGAVGHINAASNIGDWAVGRIFLEDLIDAEVHGHDGTHRYAIVSALQAAQLQIS